MNLKERLLQSIHPTTRVFTSIEQITQNAYSLGLGDMQSMIFAAIRRDPKAWHCFIEEVESGEIAPDPWWKIDLAHDRVEFSIKKEI